MKTRNWKAPLSKGWLSICIFLLHASRDRLTKNPISLAIVCISLRKSVSDPEPHRTVPQVRVTVIVIGSSVSVIRSELWSWIEAMFKFLKEVVSGSGTGLKDLPYNIGEPYASAWGSWLHFRGTSKVTHSLSLLLIHILLTPTLCT